MKKWIIIIIIIVVIIIIGGIVYKSGNKPQEFDTVTAKKIDLIQEVNITGQVKAAQEVDLAFESSGKVKDIKVVVGQKVIKDQILALLNNNELVAQLNQAYASVENAQASLSQYEAALSTQEALLAEYEKGTRPEEITIAQTDVDNAKKSLTDYKTSLQNANAKAESDLANDYDDSENIIKDAYSKSYDAVINKTEGMFNDENSSEPDLTFATTNSFAELYSENYRYKSNTALAGIKTILDNYPETQPAQDTALTNAESQLITIYDFLVKLNEALNNQLSLSSTTLSAYQTNIFTAQTNINTALSNIRNQIQTISAQKITNQNNIDTAQANLNTAGNTLNKLEDTLILKKAGYTQEQIDGQKAKLLQAEANIKAQRAQIKSAQANASSYQAKIAKTIIKSPIDGIVTTVDSKLGEIIAMNEPMITVISENNYQIEADVPEVDIAKIRGGEEALLTLDAFGSDEEFGSIVLSIDPAEKIIEGVPTYKVTFEFIKKYEGVKSGMTANIDIITAKRENVIAIPQRSVLKQDGNKIVRVLNFEGTDFSEVEVKTGLRASDGNIEILSGVTEGDNIVVSIKNGE